MTTKIAPAWAQHLTDDDEWIVRTALANIASDLERAGDAREFQPHPSIDASSSSSNALHESAQRYRETLARIDRADA
jgi:hypothetical protein